MKKLYLTTAIALAIPGTSLFAQFNSAGTDYSKQLLNQEKWTEDRSNDFVSLPNSFACMISNSRPDVNVNGEWRVLIDPVACGLEDEDPEATGRAMMSALAESSRASNQTPQEMKLWLETVDGLQYIANSTLRQSAENLAPYGDWYVSFLRSGTPDGSGGTTRTTASDASSFGFVDITEAGNDVEVLVSEKFAGDDNFGSYEGTMRSKVVYVGGSADATKFIGENIETVTPQGGQAQTNTMRLAGATSANFYYRTFVDAAGAVVPASGVCLDRSTVWETAHQSSLFDATTGAEVSLSGAFDFETSGGQSGRFATWGVWIDGGDVLFNPQKTSEAVTSSDGTAMTLKWSPGKLQERTRTSEPLSDGDVFKTWDPSLGEVTATWDAANRIFNLVDSDGNPNVMTSTTDTAWMWSDLKRVSVEWNGGTTVSIVSEDEKTWDASFAGVPTTKFYAKWTDTQNSNPGKLPIDYTKYAANVDINNSNNHPFYSTGQQSSTREIYWFTGSTPGGTFEPHTLYLDGGTDVTQLSSDDKPVRFDFGVNDAQTAYTPYTASGFGTQAPFDLVDGLWPNTGVDLILASEFDDVNDTACKANDVSGCSEYSWNTDASPWGQSIMAFNTATGAQVALDPALRFAVEIDSTKDRNGTLTLASLATSDPYHPLKGCTKQPGDEFETCTNVKVSDFNNRKFVIEFDGQYFSGMPGLEVCRDSACDGGTYWQSLMNFNDGTALTDMTGGNYVIAASKIAAIPTVAPNSSSCNSIEFTSLTDLGLALSDLPTVDRSSVTYPLPQQAWTDKPVSSALDCTVTMGDAGDCTGN